MTTQINAGDKSIITLCNASDVENFLNGHPEFFIEHPEMLLQIEVPHPSGGAVSLIERQVALLRQESKLHRERIRELVEIARENEAIVEKLHLLSLQLIASNNLDAYIAVLRQQLYDNFSANHVRLVMFKEYFEGPEKRLEFVSRSDEGLRNFGKFLAHKKAICGRFNSHQLAFLFGDRAQDVQSMALIPLIDGEAVGMLAIASSNADHFRVGMSTSFLSSLGDLSSAVLKRYLN